MRIVPSCALVTVKVIPFTAILNEGFATFPTKVVVEEDDDSNSFELEEILNPLLDEDSTIKSEELDDSAVKLLDIDSELEDSSDEASDEDDN